jgi:hypothetical protein
MTTTTRQRPLRRLRRPEIDEGAIWAQAQEQAEREDEAISEADRIAFPLQPRRVGQRGRLPARPPQGLLGEGHPGRGSGHERRRSL